MPQAAEPYRGGKKELDCVKPARGFHASLCGGNPCALVIKLLYGSCHTRPTVRIKSSASFGPQPPAGYSTSGTRASSFHESRIPCTNSHDFSTNCALMNSVWSPSITSSSSRSYPSGDAPLPNAVL